MEPTHEFEIAVEDTIEHGVARLSEVNLHYVELGPEDGPLVVLLHGFPEFWYSWRHQLPALASAGYRVVAPDQRGYNRSDKPSKVGDYRVDKLATDVCELITELGYESATLVGHDWGAMVTWMTAMLYPELVDRIAILNVPHPVTFQKGLWTFRQLRKSWYMGFFQLPLLPEKWAAANDYAQLRKLFANDPVNPDAFTPADIERYVEAFKQPGAITGAMNWYRAAARTSMKDLLAEIDIPTLVIWGVHDVALGEELAEPPDRWVKDFRVEKLDASHWVQCDAPERVNSLLLHFLAEQ